MPATDEFTTELVELWEQSPTDAGLIVWLAHAMAKRWPGIEELHYDEDTGPDDTRVQLLTWLHEHQPADDPYDLEDALATAESIHHHAQKGGRV